MPDPMEALRLPVVPVAPRPAFAAELRTRLASWLGGDDPTPAAPAATARVMVTPYLSVRGAAEAIPWYIDVLGAVAVGDPIMHDDGRVGHMELSFGGAMVELADEFPEMDILSPLSRGGPTMGLQLVVEDCDAVFARAVASGAAPRREPEDQFYGARAATIRDPWGHEWMLFQPIETVSTAMMTERLAGTEYELRPLEELGIPEVELGRRRADSVAEEEHRPANRPGDMGYFTIDVPDPDAAAAFFSELFGWQVEQGHLDEGRHIAGIAPPGGIHGARPPGVTLFFRVEDLQAAAAKVRELGGEVLSVSDWPTGGNATCRDPQGVTFELWKPAPGY